MHILIFVGLQTNILKSSCESVDTSFWHGRNIIKMASNGEVIYMKEFRIIDMNIFEIWVIAVRFHLEVRNYAQSTKILYSKYSLAD